MNGDSLSFVARDKGEAVPPLGLAAGMAVLVLVAAAAGGRADLSDAPRVETVTLDRLLGAEAWPRRAIAAVRLERYGCAASRERLAGLLADPAWQVRAYAAHALGRRGEAHDPVWLADEEDPKVVRTAIRHGYPLAAERLRRGARALVRSRRLQDKLLGAEIAAASGDEELLALGRDAVKEVILRMSRPEAGAFSPRLAVITGQRDMRRRHRWQQWLLKTGRGLTLTPGLLAGRPGAPAPLSRIARLDPERFGALEAYITALHDRTVDLAICLDCTASMSGELAAAQGDLDDLILFVSDVVAEFRVGLVVFRDRGDRFETKGWDFTSDVDEVRRRLWRLTAEGGGDTREAVYPALKLAYTRMSWAIEHTRVLVLIGDAPPHVGFGGACIDLARRAAEAGLTTHTIQAEGKEVEHFAGIADAGGGECVSLADDDLLISEIAGLTLGDAFPEELRAFFRTYLALCR